MTANPDRDLHSFEVKLLGNHSPSNINPNGTHTITSSSLHSLPTSAPSTFNSSDKFTHSNIHNSTHSANASTISIPSFPATITSLSKPFATSTSGNHNPSEPPPNIMGSQYSQPGSAGIVIACVMGILGIFCTILTVIHCLQLRTRKQEAKRIKDYNSEFDFSDRISDNESDKMFLTITTESQSTFSLKNQSHSILLPKSKSIQILEKFQTSSILKFYNESNHAEVVEELEELDESDIGSENSSDFDNVDLKSPMKV